MAIARLDLETDEFTDVRARINDVCDRFADPTDASEAFMAEANPGDLERVGRLTLRSLIADQMRDRRHRAPVEAGEGKGFDDLKRRRISKTLNYSIPTASGRWVWVLDATADDLDYMADMLTVQAEKNMHNAARYRAFAEAIRAKRKAKVLRDVLTNALLEEWGA